MDIFTTLKSMLSPTVTKVFSPLRIWWAFFLNRTIDEHQMNIVQKQGNSTLNVVAVVIFFSQSILIKMSSFLFPFYSFCFTLINVGQSLGHNYMYNIHLTQLEPVAFTNLILTVCITQNTDQFAKESKPFISNGTLGIL